MLKCDYFDPVVEDWTPECIENEYREKETSDYQLFVLTPAMTGCFSVAEFIDASRKIPMRTIVAVIGDWTEKPREKKSLDACVDLAKRNGATVFESLEEIAEFLNAQVRKPEPEKPPKYYNDGTMFFDRFLRGVQ
jgi:hypothetical protein